MTTSNRQLGSTLRAEIARMDLTIGEFAGRTSMSRGTIDNHIRCNDLSSLDQFEAYAAAFSMHPVQLFGLIYGFALPIPIVGATENSPAAMSPGNQLSTAERANAREKSPVRNAASVRSKPGRSTRQGQSSFDRAA